MRKSLKDIRNERGFMQKEIIKSIKISTVFYSLIESGERMNSMKLLQLLLKKSKLNYNTLF